MGAEDVSGLSAEDAVTLDAVLDEPMARAVLCASTEGRAWAMRQYRQWCARGGRAGGIRRSTPLVVRPPPRRPTDASHNGCSVDSRGAARSVAEAARALPPQ
jgi:hypothetical protein